VGQKTAHFAMYHVVATVQDKTRQSWVQALADISCSTLCSRPYSNKTRTPIANPPNSAQLEGTPYNSPIPKLHLGPCSSVGMQQATDRHTDASDQYTFCLGYASCKM